jgi:hypothetical protein
MDILSSESSILCFLVLDTLNVHNCFLLPVLLNFVFRGSRKCPELGDLLGLLIENWDLGTKGNISLDSQKFQYI